MYGFQYGFHYGCNYLGITRHRRPCKPYSKTCECNAWKPRHLKTQTPTMGQLAIGIGRNAAVKMGSSGQPMKWDPKRAAKMINVEGLSVREVADKLSVSPNTIYTYRQKHPEVFYPEMEQQPEQAEGQETAEKSASASTTPKSSNSDKSKLSWDPVKAKELMAQQVPVTRIANMMNVKPITIYNYFRRHKVETPPAKKEMTWDPVKARELVEQQKLSIAEVADMMHVKPSAIYAYFNRHKDQKPKMDGKAAGKQGGRVLTWDPDRAAAMMEQEIPMSTIANEMGVSQGSIYAYFRRHPEKYPNILLA